jgi:dTDP-4-dehydrorhamnose 3,5-epimerase-like enzyme
MARQARFGGILDHGHEAAVYRNENKTLAIMCHVTFVVKDLRKRSQASTFGVWAVFTMLQPLSENVTVRNSIAVALFVAKS